MSHISGKRKEAERCSPSTCAVNMLNGAVFRIPQRRRRCRAQRGNSLFSLHYSGTGGGFFLRGGVDFPVKFSDFLVQSFPLPDHPSVLTVVPECKCLCKNGKSLKLLIKILRNYTTYTTYGTWEIRYVNHDCGKKSLFRNLLHI
jgi:hypothetical protein